MKSKISINDCAAGYGIHINVKLVRGVGRKPVRVILRPLHGRANHVCEDELAIKAAKLASSKGWRKIVVAPDSFEGNTIRGFNLHQYHHEEWQQGYIGAYLGSV